MSDVSAAASNPIAPAPMQGPVGQVAQGDTTSTVIFDEQNRPNINQYLTTDPYYCATQDGEEYSLGNSIAGLGDSTERQVNTLINDRMYFAEKSNTFVDIKPGWTKTVVPKALGGIIMRGPGCPGISLEEYNNRVAAGLIA